MKRDAFTMSLDLGHELIIDNFAGGGGTSTGLEAAFGRPVDIAINHDPEALAMHAMNHPHTRHLCESVWDVDPIKVTNNQPVALVWLSPDCKHFSKAKGGTPVEKHIRGLAWVALRWVAKCKPRALMLESVEEFKTWGPLIIDADGKARPDPAKRGKTFDSFVRQLRAHGYQVEWRELRACDFGAPTIRKRFFLVARRDGLPIRWPAPTHGAPDSPAVLAGLLQPHRTAAECIDWSLPCPSIFGRKRPLAEATMRRIAKGIMRYVVDAANPFIVPLTHQGADRVEAVNEPMRTVTGANRGERALVTAFLNEHANASTQRVFAADEPMRTICAGGQHHAEVRAFLVKYYGADQDPRLEEPLHTVTTKDRFGLVTIQGVDYEIVDIGLRMLAPHELYLAQGFPADYVIEEIPDPALLFADGVQAAADPLRLPRVQLTKSAQVRMCGNSVCPPVSEALIRANFVHEQQLSQAAA
jgi:DNA (cytosine-5)-methyltransferase 1